MRTNQPSGVFTTYTLLDDPMRMPVLHSGSSRGDHVLVCCLVPTWPWFGKDVARDARHSHEQRPCVLRHRRGGGLLRVRRRQRRQHVDEPTNGLVPQQHVAPLGAGPDLRRHQVALSTV